MEPVSKQQQITQGNIWKQLLIFFFPILLGTFFQQMYNTVDTIIVGRVVGTTALAAVGSTGALLSMVNGFFIGLGSGATVILSQFYGANDRRSVDAALHTGAMLSVILGAVITVFGISAGPQILKWMKTPDNCLDSAVTYIRIYFLGAVGSMVYNMGASILRAMGDSRRPMFFLMITCVLNIVMDLLFVAVLRMGVAGAAAATVLSQYLSAAMLTLVLMRNREYPLSVTRLHVDPMLLKRILQIGVPAGLQFVTFDLSNILIQSGINSFGDIVMAAFTAYAKTDTLTWMVSGAFGVAITTFVGQNFGAQLYHRVRQSVWACMTMGVPLLGAISILVYTFREFILGVYTTDPAVIQAGAYLMAIVVPFNAVFMPVEVLGGAMRGTGYSLVPTVITGTCICLFRILWLGIVVSRVHTVKMLAMCYPISWVLTACVFFAVYLQGGWLRNRIRELGMEPEV